MLLDAARSAGRHAEVDWACRVAALRGALDAGLGHGCTLFVNIEPDIGLIMSAVMAQALRTGATVVAEASRTRTTSAPPSRWGRPSVRAGCSAVRGRCTPSAGRTPHPTAAGAWSAPRADAVLGGPRRAADAAGNQAAAERAPPRRRVVGGGGRAALRGGLVAPDLGWEEDGDRQYDYAVTHDRGLVVEAGRALLRQVTPHESATGEPGGG